MSYDLDVILERAAKFLITIFDLHAKTVEQKTVSYLKKRCEETWNTEKPCKGSSHRAMVFPQSQLDSLFESHVREEKMLKEFVKKRKSFPYEFTLFMDPDGCEAVFCWGLSSKDQDNIVLYPSNNWESYLDTVLRKKLVNNTKVTSEKLTSTAVSGGTTWAEDHIPSSEEDSGPSRTPSPPHRQYRIDGMHQVMSVPEFGMYGDRFRNSSPQQPVLINHHYEYADDHAYHDRVVDLYAHSFNDPATVVA